MASLNKFNVKGKSKVKVRAGRAAKAKADNDNADAEKDDVAVAACPNLINPNPPPQLGVGARGRGHGVHPSQRQTQRQRNDPPMTVTMSGGATATTTTTPRSRCNHGLAPSHQHPQRRVTASNDLQTCKWFLQAFVTEFDGTAGDFLAAYHATKEKCALVWNDLSKMEFVVSFLLACGTGKVLEGNIKIACKYAALASYFEQHIQVEFLNTRAFPNWPKIRELYAADMHTLVSFLKKRIPCSCLDETYKEVKSIPKIGLCCNPECPLPCGMTERSATKCCSRCRASNYCSRECQVAAWQDHKGECKVYTELKAEFNKFKENK